MSSVLGVKFLFQQNFVYGAQKKDTKIKFFINYKLCVVFA